MPNVLLVVPPGIRPRAARDYAIDTVRRAGGTLIALVVLDPAETTRLAASLDSAFMGERVSDRVIEVLAREQQTRAEALLRGIREQARAAGVEFTPLVETGEPSEVCGRMIRMYQVELAVLVTEKRSWLTRFLSRSSAVKLPALAGCEVKVMEEQDDEAAGDPR